MLLTYSTQNGVDALLDNYEYSIAKGIYEIETGDGYIKVNYSIGDLEQNMWFLLLWKRIVWKNI